MMGATHIAEVVVRRWCTLVAVLVDAAAGGAGSALAEPPFRLQDRITDRAGVLDAAGTARVQEAIGRLRDDGTDLFVVYVDSFDGSTGSSGPPTPRGPPSSGSNDVLLAVAVRDRVYGASFADDYPQSESRTDAVLTDDVEPRLGAADWAGAAVAMADGLRGGGGGGGAGLAVAVVGGAAVIGGGAFLLTRRGRKAGKEQTRDAPTTAPTLRDEFSDVATEDLGYRASSALIEVDDAVRTSEQELGAAKAHFGEEAVAEFTAGVAQSRTEMVAAFEIRQQLDDEVPEDEPTKRAMYAEIIRICRAADDRLDAQVEAFDRLRDLEAKAPAVPRRARHPAGRGHRRVPAAERSWARAEAGATPTPRWRRWPATWSGAASC